MHYRAEFQPLIWSNSQLTYLYFFARLFIDFNEYTSKLHFVWHLAGAVNRAFMRIYFFSATAYTWALRNQG